MEDPSPITTISSATAELEVWKNFNLEQRKQALDKSCVDMREAKTASISGRKRLNDITKLFRSKPKEEQVLMMTEILKCYQEEIDQLSRRSKFCETTFFTLYKALYELPDPALTIDGLLNTVMSSSTNQLEIERLRGEINQYDEEFRQLKNQDITIRRLEDTLTEFKEQNENKINEEVNKRMVDIKLSADNRINEIMEIQKTIEKRYNSALESMNIAQQSADRAQTQLYEISSQSERKITALQSENSILAEGTQRLSLRLAEKERENQNIQQALSVLQKQYEHTTTSNTKKRTKNIKKNDTTSTNTTTSTNQSTEDEEEEEELKRLQILVSSLREEILNTIEQARLEKSKLDGNVRDLTQLLTKEKEINMKLQEEIKIRPSRNEYMSVKRQLKTVTKIAFNVQDEDGEEEEEQLEPSDADHPEHTSATGSSSLKGSATSEVAQLEALLAGRIKTLETELATLRRDLQEARRQETISTEQIVALRKTVETSAQMITRLETDLEARSAALEASVAASTGVSHLRSASTGSLPHQHSASSPPLDLAALLGVHENSALTAAHTGTTAAAGGGNNQINVQMISILQSQRDQYKDKLTRAETLLQKLQVDLESAQQAKQRLEADNLALYSKIKYLQSYGSSGNTYNSPQAMRISNRPVFHTPDRSGRGGGREIYNHDEYREGIAEESRQGDEEAPGGEVEGRYHQLYEQRMNPFDQFSQREKQRKLQELTVADRIVLNTTMALVSNQTGRNFLLLYLGAMHLFMFCIIYYTAHQSHAGCDASINHLSPEDTAAIAANHI